MTFASRVFLVAAIYGLRILPPQYFPVDDRPLPRRALLDRLPEEAIDSRLNTLSPARREAPRAPCRARWRTPDQPAALAILSAHSGQNSASPSESATSILETRDDPRASVLDSVAERLLRARTIIISGEITQKLAGSVSAQLLALAAESEID